MKCRTCGITLPPGAKVCPNCGTAVPRPDETVVDTSAPASPIPPTVYGGPVPVASNYDPMMQNPYDQSSQPPPPSYNNQANQYQAGSFNQNQAAPNQYGNQYGVGTVPPAYTPNYVPPVPPQPQPPRRKTRWGLIIGIIAGVLILGCIGASVLTVGGLVAIGTSVNAQETATAAANTTTTGNNSTTSATPTPADTNTGTQATPATNSNQGGTSPSGLSIDADAATIVTNAQSARNVNQQTADPVDPTSTFKAGDRVYVVFKLNNNKVDVTKQTVYVGAKFYVDNSLAAKIDPITFNQPVPGGYFAGTYKVASQGTAELYLCYKSDCSDGKLAQVVNFTVA